MEYKQTVTCYELANEYWNKILNIFKMMHNPYVDMHPLQFSFPNSVFEKVRGQFQKAGYLETFEPELGETLSFLFYKVS